MSGPSRASAEFVSEAQEVIDALSRGLLALDKARGRDADPDLVNSVFRAAHSLKGISSMFGADRLASLAHALEDLLDAVRLGRAHLEGAVIDLLLESVDLLQRMVGEVGEQGDGTGSDASAAAAKSLTQRIARARRRKKPASTDDPLDAAGIDASVRKVLTEYEEHRLRENVARGATLLRVRADFDLADFDKRLADINARLKPIGEIISTLPSATPSGPSRISFDVIFGTKEPVTRVEGALQDMPVTVEPVGKAAESPVVMPPRERPTANVVVATPSFEPETTLRSATQSVRVDIGKLDHLMNVVGELVLMRTNIQRLTDALRTSVADGDGAPQALQGHLAELTREGRSLERKLNELQVGILDVRMVPLVQVFDKLARMVRKIAREADKDIDLRVSGGQVELDKLIVEELSDPLMHLVRNAIDHGIESAEARARHGKPRRGTIGLDAFQKGNHVVIEVSDDGAGIDEERVKRVAVKRGLATVEAVAALSRRDLLNFIFMPGFSTAREVSELSGRGVGLDVVKTNIANLSGIIDVDSRPGQGTTMSITLPVTLAIIRALLVGVSGRTYAVPLNSVIEIAEVPATHVRTLSAREVIDLRGTTLPLVRLGRLFRHPELPRTQKLQVVVVGLAQERVGMAVDDLTGQQDIVIKSLGGMLPPLPGIAGATDLGQRRTVLVLDVGAIIGEVLHAPVASSAV
jgi:two-component system, chemotaxis family, sensor kinase CheA